MVEPGEQLTLFAAASPDLASHSVMPGSAEARQMTVTSGRKCSELYGKSGPVGCLVRMLLESPIWHSTLCYLTWKPKATKQGRLLFQLVPSAPRTGGTGYGFWPTPTSRDYKDAGSCKNVPVNYLLGRVVKKWGKGNLNPDFTECLMGLPTGWTCITGLPHSDASSTTGSRREQQQKKSRTGGRDCRL